MGTITDVGEINVLIVARVRRNENVFLTLSHTKDTLIPLCVGRIGVYLLKRITTKEVLGKAFCLSISKCRYERILSKKDGNTDKKF